MTGSRRIFALALLTLVYFMDGYDIAAMGLALPRLEGPLGLRAESFGWVSSWFVIGMGLAAAFVAPLGDRYGRRALIVAGCLIVALMTVATTSATSLPEFMIWRALTGFGLGCCLPNVTALSADLAPPRLKAAIMSVASAGIPLGLSAAGYLTPSVVAAAGWHGLFFVPGILATVLAVLLWFVLAGKPPESAVAAPPKVPQIELLRAPWDFPFAIFAGALALNAINLYLFGFWLPTVLPRVGFTLDGAAQMAGTVQLAGLVLGIFLSFLIDRWRPGATMILSFAIMTISFIAIGLMQPDPSSWGIFLIAGVGGASAAGMALPALSSYLFPSRLLGSAMGLGVFIGRIGAIAAPPIGGIMLAAGISPNLFFAAAALPTALATLLCFAVPAALRVRAAVSSNAG